MLQAFLLALPVGHDRVAVDVPQVFFILFHIFSSVLGSGMEPHVHKLVTAVTMKQPAMELEDCNCAGMIAIHVQVAQAQLHLGPVASMQQTLQPPHIHPVGQTLKGGPAVPGAVAVGRLGGSLSVQDLVRLAPDVGGPMGMSCATPQR